MKVLVINNTIFYEESGQLFLNKETGRFFLRLKELGFDVSTFQISQLKRAEDSFADFSISNKGLTIYHVKRRESRLGSFFKSFFVIQKAIFKNDFVYIFYPGPICIIIALFCVLYKKPFGLYIRGEQGISSKLSRFIIRKASTVFTISPKFTDTVLRTNKNVQTIRPMIGFTEEDIVFKRDFDFKNNRIKLLYVGRIVFDKGIFELLNAVKILKERGFNIMLNLVGNGTDLKKLQKKVVEYGLVENVVFCGMISNKEEMIDIYRNSDVFVLPTYHEGFPRVLYEAMMMHLPILTTFVGTIDYLMKNEFNCLEIKVKEAESIVSAVEKIVIEKDLVYNIARNGSETIVKYLANKKLNHSEQLNKVIQEL